MVWTLNTKKQEWIMSYRSVIAAVSPDDLAGDSDEMPEPTASHWTIIFDRSIFGPQALQTGPLSGPLAYYVVGLPVPRPVHVGWRPPDRSITATAQVTISRST